MVRLRRLDNLTGMIGPFYRPILGTTAGTRPGPPRAHGLLSPGAPSRAPKSRCATGFFELSLRDWSYFERRGGDAR